MKKSWEYKKLGEIGESELGKTKDSTRNKGILLPYLCAVNVLWDRFDLSNLKEMKFEDNEKERYSIRKGDLIICEGGDIGRAAIWNDERPILYQNALHRVRFKEGIEARFILYYLFHLKIKGILDERYGKGVTIKHLVKTSLLSIPIPVPPIEEQKRIVEELDLLSGIIEKQKKQLKELDTLAQSIFYDMFGDPVTNENNLQKTRLDHLCEVTSSRRIFANEYCEKGVPFYRGKEISQLSKGEEISIELYISTERYNELLQSNNIPILNDILITAVGTVGNIWVVNIDSPFYFKDGNIIWLRKINNNVVNPKYFSYSLSKLLEFVKESLLSGSAYKALTIVNLKKMPVILPPLPLQNLFAEKIEAIEKQKEAIGRSIEETQKLFDYTMDKYFG